jgi:hypothetical protein
MILWESACVRGLDNGSAAGMVSSSDQVSVSEVCA